MNRAHLDPKPPLIPVIPGSSYGHMFVDATGEAGQIGLPIMEDPFQTYI